MTAATDPTECHRRADRSRSTHRARTPPAPIAVPHGAEPRDRGSRRRVAAVLDVLHHRTEQASHQRERDQRTALDHRHDPRGHHGIRRDAVVAANSATGAAAAAPRLPSRPAPPEDHGRPHPPGVLVREPRVRDRRDDPARVSVAVGLAMSGRLARRPGLPAKLKHFHESATLVTLGLIVAHAGLLLFDSYLRPGPRRNHAPVRARLPPAVHRHRDHRRLAGGDPRTQLLRAQVDRRQDVAVHAPLHDRRLPAGAGPRDRVRHRRSQSRGWSRC